MVPMDDVLKAIRAKQSEARWRGNTKAARLWEQIEFLVIDALVDFYGGEFL